MDSPGLDDSALLRRARGDAEAFGAFYRRHARAVYRSLLGACGTLPFADDDSLVARMDAAASRGRLDDVLDELPESQRSVLRLRIEDEATYEEIASRLGCSPAAARQQASRGMRRLTNRFQAAME